MGDIMKGLKHTLLFGLVFVLIMGFASGCSKENNVSGTLEEIMTKVYADIPEEERPMMLMNVELTKENVEMYLGTSDIEFKEGLASESATGSIPHSVVLIRVDDKANIDAIKEKIENSVNPRKWICVEAEDVEVENKGNLIILIMSSEANTEKIENSFKKL